MVDTDTVLLPAGHNRVIGYQRHLCTHPCSYAYISYHQTQVVVARGALLTALHIYLKPIAVALRNTVEPNTILIKILSSDSS